MLAYARICFLKRKTSQNSAITPKSQVIQLKAYKIQKTFENRIFNNKKRAQITFHITK